MYFPHLPAIHVLRLFRAFRVVRIFKRVKEMRKIIEGIIKSLPSLSYAFIAMALIIGIWAIMGVDFFAEIELDDTGEENVELEELGEYYFGTFFRACLSLGQITTFDSWSSGIARDIIYAKGNGAAVYFLSFIFIAGIIMMNVLVALLLDNYLSTDTEDDDESDMPNESPLGYFTWYVKKHKIDLENFAKYLNNKAIPEYIENIYDQQTSEGTSPSAIVMSIAKPPKNRVELSFSPAKNTDVIYGILSRIERRLSVVEDTNDQLSSIINRMENTDGIQTNGGKPIHRISLAATEDLST